MKEEYITKERFQKVMDLISSVVDLAAQDGADLGASFEKPYNEIFELLKAIVQR